MSKLLKGGLVHKYANTVKTFTMPFSVFKKATDLTANPPAADSTNLTIVTGTYGTNAATIQSADGKAATTSPKTRFQFAVPPTYQAGGAISVIVNAGMLTTVADTSCTLKVDCYRPAAPTTNIGPIAQSINSLTAADKTFALTTTSVVPGDILDIDLVAAITDGATGTVVKAKINKVQIQLIA